MKLGDNVQWKSKTYGFRSGKVVKITQKLVYIWKLEKEVPIYTISVRPDGEWDTVWFRKGSKNLTVYCK